MTKRFLARGTRQRDNTARFDIEHGFRWGGVRVEVEEAALQEDLRIGEIRITRLRDMVALLKRINETSNRDEAIYCLRFLVTKLCSLTHKAFLEAKNLLPELRYLVDEVVRLLDGPVAQRLPHLARILVRNISAIVLRPNLIDRLWHDTIELAEIQVRGSAIANELRRSTHHAIGQGTLRVGNAYLHYLRTGETQPLIDSGFDGPAKADEEARDKPGVRPLVERIVEDLETLLGSSEIVTRIRDWQDQYRQVLLRCDLGNSMADELEELVGRGLREHNRWVYYHHLRILSRKIEEFEILPGAGPSLVQRLEELQRLKPDEAGFDADAAEQEVRALVADFTERVQTTYQTELFAGLDEVLGAYESERWLEAIRAARR